MFQDFSFAFRTLRKAPAFSIVAILSLALGVGANTAIFSFVNAILLKRLPVPEPERLVTFAEMYRGQLSEKVWRMSTIAELAKDDHAFSGVFGRFVTPVSFSTGDAPQWLLGELVTGQYFQTMKAAPFAGRLLNDQDVANAAANPVCILSYNFWQRTFAGNRSAVGQTIFLNGHAYKVLGITEEGFLGTDLQHRFDLQIPATRIGDFMPFGTATGIDCLKTLSWLSPMARLRPGVTRMQAQVQTHQLLDDIGQSRGDTKHQETLQLQDGSRGFNDMTEFGRPLLVLMAVVALVLLVACANLANLLLARSQTRAKEFAVRMSIGASRSQLIRQLLTESVLLASVGGTLGLLLSFWITQTLLAFLNVGKSPAAAIVVAPDATVFAFCIVLSFTTVLVFGLMPARRATRLDLLPGLTDAFNGGAHLRGVLTRRALVVAQIALSLIVVFAAGLLTRTLKSLQTLDLGFKPEHVVAMKVDPEAAGHSSVEGSRILDDVLSRVRAYPGVTAASLAASSPNGSRAFSMNVDVPGYLPKQPGDDIADFNFVSPAYFQTLGQSLLQGRDFNGDDDKNTPRVAIVNKKFATKYWGHQNVVGRKFHQGDSEVEIVGLVADARDRGIRNNAQDSVYLSVKQSQTAGLTLLVRTASPEAIIPSLLAIVRGIDKRIPVSSIHTLGTQIRAGLSSERILGYLSSLFATLSTLLAGIGLYGVLSYSVTRRTREIGVRFAIGAQASDVAAFSARETLMLLALGLIIGAPLALLSVQALKGLLFGVATTDPYTLFLSVCTLSAASLLAIAQPLWRATRINPLVALRYE